MAKTTEKKLTQDEAAAETMMGAAADQAEEAAVEGRDHSSEIRKGKGGQAGLSGSQG